MVHLSLTAALLFGAAPFVWCSPGLAESPSQQGYLKVWGEPEGGFSAAGALPIAASPASVEAVLTDYEKWPELFGTRVRVVKVDRRDDRVITEVYMEYGFPFGSRRLVCENRLLPAGGLASKLVEGDFRQYHRIWRLKADREAMGTLAELEFRVEVETWAPDWLIANLVRGELEAHFERLKAKAERRGRPR